MTATATAPSTAPAAAPRRLRRRLSTPGRYRVSSVAVTVLLVLVTVLGTVFYVTSRRASDRLEHNTGPVLVATQSLVASLGEADAAATAAFLSGRSEDRDARNEYLDSIARADQQLEQVASLIGGDPAAHRVLQDLAVAVTRYAALVEAARAENLGGVPGAASSLTSAVDLLSGTVTGDAATLTSITERDFSTESHRRSAGVGLAVGLAAAAIAVLVGAQVDVARRSRRIVNLPLFLATLALVAVLVWVVTADRRAGADVRTARRAGYASIALTARIQTDAFASKSDETLALVTGDAAKNAAADDAARAVAAGPITADLVAAARQGDPLVATGLLAQAASAADSARTRAAAAEMMVRWQRYRDAVAVLRRAATPAARATAFGAVSSTFDGFNVSVVSVLGDSRTEFDASLTRAADRLGGLELVVLLGGGAALLLVLAGYQARINEYR